MKKTLELAKPTLLIAAVLSVGLALTASADAPTCVPAPPGLVGWWAGEANASDSAGTNNGALHGGMSFVAGEAGQAFNFNGSSGYVDMPASASLNVGAGAGLTFECWIKPAALADAQPLAEWNNGTQAGAQLWISRGLPFGGGAGSICVNLIDTSGAFHTLTTGPGVLNTNGFQHVALSYDKVSGMTTLYCNGVLVAAGTLGSFTPQTSVDLYLGKHISDASFDAFQGLMDEASLYNRALSAAEIQAIYSADGAGKCPNQAPGCVTPPAGLVGWWRGEGAADDAAGTNNGVLEGGLAFAAGEVGQAFSFNGTNADVRIPASDSVNVGLADGFTIETWINPADIAQEHPVVEWNNGSFGVHFWIAVAGAGPGSLWLNVKDTSFNDHPLSTAAGLLVSNAWQHVAATYNKSNGNAVLYINGVPRAQETLGAFTARTIGDLYIGVRPYDAGAGLRFAGLMDEVSLYGRALSASEIQAIYNAGSAGKCQTPAPPPCSPPPAGLVSWWSAEGNALDSADSNNGTLQGDATFTPGKVGQAFNFNPASGTVVVPDSPSLRLTSELTIEGWINTRANTDPGGYAIVSKLSYPTGNNGYQFLVVGNTLQALFNSPGTSWPSQRIISGPIISTGVWYHVAFTYDQSAMKLYCNGLLVTNQVIGAHAIATSSSDLHISGVDSDHTYFDGMIDEPAVYNRALSDTEIAAIYNAGSAGKCQTPVQPPCAAPPAGLVSCWRGEGAAGDWAGTNNGVLEGGVEFAAGEVGQAFQFNGTDANVRVPASASLNVGLADGFTIETWINPADITQHHPVVEWNNGLFGVHLTVADGAGNGPGSLLFDVKDTTLQDHFFSTPAGLLISNGWQHVAATYARSNGNAVIYINGVARAQATLGAFTPRTIGDLYVGLRPYDGGAGLRFVGLMDEVSLYNRALSAAEIQAIFSAGSAGKCLTGTPPSISAQPASQTVTAGSTVTFAVTAGGTPPLSYQWRVNGTNLAGGNSSTLALNNVQLANAGAYSVVVSNLAGSVTSSNAELIVNASSSCAPGPQGLVSWWRGEGVAGDSVGTNNGVLEGSVAFAAGEVGQAFSFNGINADVRVPASASLNVGLADGFTIETWINPADITQEHPVVEWNDGSFGVHLWVAAAVGAGPGSLWINAKDTSFNDHPLSTAAGLLVSNAWQHVAATYVRSNGSTVLYINGVARAQTTLGAFTPRTIGNLYIGVRPYDAGAGERFVGLMDEVSLYNRALTAAEIAAIYNAGSSGKCGLPPGILAQPQSVVAAAGSNVTFTATATGTPPLSYQWRLSGTNIAGATGTSLTLSNVQPDQAGNYAVLVTNAFGSILSSNAILAVNPPRPCATAPAGLVSWWAAEGNATDSASANSGTLVDGATFATGEVGQAFSLNGTSQYVSVPDSASLRPTNLTLECWVNFATTSDVRVLVAKPYGSALYNSYCLWYQNGQLNGGIATTTLTTPVLRKTWAPVLGTWHHIAYTFNSGTHIHVLYLDGVAVTGGTASGTIGYDNQPLLIGADISNGAYSYFHGGLLDEVSLYSRALSAAEIRSIYTAGSSGKCGLPPGILTQPQSVVAAAGSNVTFTATATGTTPLSYQWRFSGTNIDGATGASLTLSNVQPALAGNYTLRVTNAFGSTTSSNAVLTVNQASGCANPPEGLVGWWRGEGNGNDSADTNNAYALPNAAFTNGIVGQAFAFDPENLPYGTYSGVRVADQPAYALTNSLTIEGWIRPRGDGWVIFYRGDNRSGLDPYSMGMGLNNILGFGITDASGNSASVSAPLVYNQWWYVVGTLDGASGELSLYTNGTLAAQITTTVRPIGNLMPGNSPGIGIGNVNDGFNNFPFQGDIDEISLYNRALSAAEIQAIYSADGAGKCLNQAPPCATPPAGLVSCWRGEGTAGDWAGTNNGVLEGGVEFAAGEVGQAFQFNGTNADVRVPASASLNVGLADGFTIETWINPADITQEHPVVEWNNGRFGVSFWVASAAGTGPGSLFIDVKDTTLNDHPVSTTAGLLVSNVWQHVAATYVRSNGSTVLYINGVARAQATLGAFTPRTIGDLYVGVRPYDGGAGLRFVGLMDEVSLYDRALSAAEVQAIYNAGGAGKCLTGTPPSISAQPASQTVTAGSTVAFTVAAGGTPPLSYQWRCNGTNLDGANSSTLALNNVQLANAGAYSVVVTNLAGSVTSSNAELIVNASSSCAPVPSGLVSWWRGEGVASDSAGTNNGVLEGGVAFDVGEVGQAFQFNGTNADVRVPASASLNVGLADGFTIETWINPADVVQAHPLVEWNNGSFGVHLWIAANAGPGSLFIDVKDTTLHDHYFSTAAGLLVSNVWQHVAATYTKSNGNTVLYINGVPRAQAILGVFTPRTIGDLYVGLRPYDGGAGTRFVGLMDEVSLYNRALSASEIQAIYNADGAGKCLPGTPPSVSAQPASQTVTAGSTVVFTVTASGTAPLSYQWRVGGTNLAGATSASFTLANVQAESAGSYSVRVTNAFGSVTSEVATLTVNVPTPPTLLNVNFAAYSQVKVGFAGTGLTASDFWNNYTAPFQPLASLSNLTMADGTPTTVGLTVQNGAGHWAFTHPDLMYNCYCYSQNHGDITLTVTNLASGQYDFYLYGHGNIERANTVFQVLVGGADYGNQPTGTNSDSLSTNWLEGAQYVVYRNVAVTNGGAPVTIKAHPGSTGDAMLNGIQISSGAGVAQVPTQRAELKVIAPSDSLGSTLQLEVRGAPSRIYVIQASTNLMDWGTIGLGATDTEGNVQFTDPNAVNEPCRFYRAVGQ